MMNSIDRSARGVSDEECELSVVVAASHEDDEGHVWPECLSSIAQQIDGRAVEVFAITDDAREAREIREAFPDMIVIESDLPRAVQPLWGLGMPRARGRVIAITDACCIPGDGWIETILKAHGEGKVAVGGAIEMAPGSRASDWAVYFTRYFVRDAPLATPFTAGPTLEVPCENGTYDREALSSQMEAIGARGFYEVEVNPTLRSQGFTLWCDPAIVVWYNNKFSIAGFIRHRLTHGREFGRTRAAGCSGIKRALYVLATPVVPLVLVSRVVRNVWKKPRYLGPFARSLPLVVTFVACWGLGELGGLLWWTRHRSSNQNAPR